MPPSSSRSASATGSSSERIAAWVFAIYLSAALPVLLGLGSHYWFRGDEWAFFAGGSITDPAVLFRSINLHWSTLPILVYHTLYSVFGLHSYLPFQLVLILLHLTLCYLLRVIMRRAGVGPWVATICAASFVLFGVGKENILSGVQISQVGSIVLGLIHLLLADHDGPNDWRDWLGLLCGMGSIMSSGFGPPMVVIVGLAVICRRGWQPAAFHTIPLAVVYLSWWIVNHTSVMTEHGSPSPFILAFWVIAGVGGVFLSLGGYPVVAVALCALFVTGLILAWKPLSLAALRQQAHLPLAMLTGAVALQTVIGLERWPMIYILGWDAPHTGRYLSVCAALALPAFAVAADAVVRRWRWMLPVVCALLLVGIGVNMTRFGSDSPPSAEAFADSRAALLAAAYSPLAASAPPDLMPEPHGFAGGQVEMSFLLAARDSGRLPPPPIMTDALQSQTELRLSVQQLAGPVPQSHGCAEYAESIELAPKVGDLYKFTTPVLISLGETGAPLAYNSDWGSLPAIRILRADLRLHLAPKTPAASFVMCQ